jgi:hypothetical protein
MKGIEVNGVKFNADWLKTVKRSKAITLLYKQDKETVGKAWDAANGVKAKTEVKEKVDSKESPKTETKAKAKKKKSSSSKEEESK